MVAIFVCGLKDDARIWKKVGKVKDALERQLLAMIYDRLSWVAWGMSEDGSQGVNRPESVYSKLYRLYEDDDSNVMKFETPDSFKAEWERRVNNANLS